MNIREIDVNEQYKRKWQIISTTQMISFANATQIEANEDKWKENTIFVDNALYTSGCGLICTFPHFLLPET